MIPVCCNRKMNIVIETTKFYEAHCDKCSDVVYVKKDDIEKPIILDD